VKSRIAFYTLVLRECYRFARLAGQTIAPPVITTLLYIFIFGFSLGSRIKQIGGFDYVLYILPGLASMGVINNAYANSSTSLFMARMDRSIENMVVCPLSPLQMVSAFVIGGLMRGMLVGVMTLLVGVFTVHLQVNHWPHTLLVLALSSVLFSSLGILSSLWAEGWDQIATFTNFIITPFIYLGGVFYSIHMLPGFWQKVSLFNPIFYLVDATRSAVLGRSDIGYWYSLGFLGGAALLSYGFCVYLFRRGYKLVR